MSNQLLGVTPNRWPTNFFLHFSSCVSHEPLARMMEEVLFSSFYNVFHRFWPCERMRKHAFIVQNRRQTSRHPLLGFYFYFLCWPLSHHGRNFCDVIFKGVGKTVIFVWQMFELDYSHTTPSGTLSKTVCKWHHTDAHWINEFGHPKMVLNVAVS